MVAAASNCALLTGDEACRASVNCPYDEVCSDGVCRAADRAGFEGEGEGAEGEGEGEGAPIVAITSPADGSFLRAGDSATFTSSAVDEQDGPVPNTDIRWSSSEDGALGVGGTVSNALTTLGVHTISCAATDRDGNVGNASIQVTVGDQFPPVATILQPADGSFFSDDQTITFSGSANDVEDGALGNVAMRWLDGDAQLGIGAAVSTARPIGDHVITLAATDSNGAIGTRTITIHVVDTPPPQCAITTSQNGASVAIGVSVSFAASCADADGGAIDNGAYSWRSDIDGALGAGANVTNALVTAGVHQITVCGADPADAAVVGCTSVTLNVVD